ncbi:MAG: MarR family transcriptional regulator [Pseudolysinimonas sp.]|uniref:MarR family winged helix-turn-helix transcriptional regulator n=1 Tax=Pseudolysinimonas sp. TaxID=2680009 RepID=UPI003266A0FB
MTRAGPHLALLLLSSYRKLADAAQRELADWGYGSMRSSLHYAMSAIERGAASASELGRALSVTKQAAAKTITILVERGYVVVDQDPTDRRRRSLRVTEWGHQATTAGEAIFDELRAQWADRIGSEALDRLEAQLTEFVGDDGIQLEKPGAASAD